MYNESYDEYIRNILGYPNYNNQYSTQDYYTNYNNLYGENYDNSFRQEENRGAELEDWYPEIYKIVYPMVKKTCRGLEGKITKEKIVQIEEELYSNIEGNDEIYLNINLNNEVNRNEIKPDKSNTRNETGKDKIETRYCNNCNNKGLKDIIRILLLREILGRPNKPNNRPPFPIPPRPRPPFFPNGPVRPPFPRGYDDIYEY